MAYRGPKQRSGLRYPLRKIVEQVYREEKVLDSESGWTGQTKQVLYHILECGHEILGSKQEGAGSRKNRRCKMCQGYVEKNDPTGRGIL